MSHLSTRRDAVRPAVAERADPPATGPDTDLKVVAWRDFWLAPSETFIRDQVLGLSRWTPVCVGRRQYAKPLVAPTFAPHSDALTHRIASRLPAARPVKARYHELMSDPVVKIVHAHFGQDGVAALPYAVGAGKPLVVSFYGMDTTSLPFRRSLTGRRYRARLPALFDAAHTLVTVSQFLSDRLAELGAPESKIRLHYPGTTVHDLPGPEARRSGIIFVGRLVEKKGVADLLDAVALLPEPLRSTPITVVGYGPLLRGLQQQASRLLLDVNFVGQKSSAEIAALLRSHAIFCGPSKRASNGDAEGLGMVFIEAALAGLPVVAYRHGGVPESVDHARTGLLAPEGDIAALSGHLGALLADPEGAAAMGRAGYHSCVQKFELHSRKAKLEELYDDVHLGRS